MYIATKFHDSAAYECERAKLIWVVNSVSEMPNQYHQGNDANGAFTHNIVRRLNFTGGKLS